MGIIADKLRNGTTSIEQMNQDIAAREAEEQANAPAPEPGSYASTWEMLTAGDIDGLYEKVSDNPISRSDLWKNDIRPGIVEPFVDGAKSALQEIGSARGQQAEAVYSMVNNAVNGADADQRSYDVGQVSDASQYNYNAAKLAMEGPASFVPAVGIGAFVGNAINKGIEEESPIAAIRAATYGPAADYVSQDNLMDKIIERPVTTLGEGAMSILPVLGAGYVGVKGGKAGYKAAKDYAEQRAVDKVIDNNIDITYPMDDKPATYASESTYSTGIDKAVDSYVDAAAVKTGVDPNLLAKLVDQESTYGRDPNAGGNLAQVSNDVAGKYGLDPNDPAQSIEAGARYLKEQMDANGGDVREALAAYNAGPGNKAAGYGYADSVLGREIGGETRSTATGGAMDVGEQAWLGQEMPNGASGCVDAVVRVGSYHDSFLAGEAKKGVSYVPTLVADAGDRVIPFDPARLEKGDVIVYGDNDHVVLYDGNGGYVGNSTSLKRVVHGADYREMGDGLQPTQIIKTAERPEMQGEVSFSHLTGGDDANVDVLGNEIGAKLDTLSSNDYINKTDAMQADVDTIINRDAPAQLHGSKRKRPQTDIAEMPGDDLFGDDIMAADARKLIDDQLGGLGIDYSVPRGSKAPKANTANGVADLPEYRPGREIETVSKQDILQRAEELFVPVYDGYTGRTIDGFTRTKTGELRTGRWGDLDTMAHELGHVIDDHLQTGNKKAFRDEFKANVERNHGENAYEASHIEREGVADFIKDYLTDEETAKQNFPGYYDRFKSRMEENPDMAQRINDMQDIYKRYNEQSPQARWGSSVTYGEQPSNKTWKEKASDVMNTIDKKVYDDLTELKGIDKIRAALKGVKELATESSIYKMARLSRGQASAYTEMLIKGKDPVGTIAALNKAFGDRGVFQHDVTLQSAMDIVKDAVKTDEGKAFLQKGNYKDAMQAMDALLSARRFSELQKIDLEKMRELSTLMRNLSDQTKSASLVEGKNRELSSNHLQEMYEAIEAKYGKDYAVLVDDAINHVLEGKKHVREDVPGNVLVDASKVFDRYIENLDDLKKHYVHEYDAPGKIADAQSVIDAAPKEFHAAAEEIYKLQDNVMRAYKDAGLISEAQYTAMQKYKNYVPLATDFGVSKGASKMFGNDSMFVNLGDEIKSQVAKDSREKVLPIKSPLATIVGNTHDMLGKAVRNKIGQLLIEDVDKKNGARLATEVRGAADPNKKTFGVWIDGERHTYQTSPEIYKILETCGDVKTGTFAIKVLRGGATLTRTTNVLGPAFQAANGLRDAYFAAFRTTGGWLGLMNPMQPGYGRAVYHLIKDAIGKDSVMEEYRATGAKMSTLAAYGHEPIQMEIMRLAGEQSKKRKVWDTFNDRVLRFGESAEALPRLREYMRVRAKGGSFEDAAYAARNITIDFSRAGEWGRDWNQIDAFFNAALQGSKVLYETAKDNPKRFGKDLAAGVVIPTVAYWAYTRNQDWYADRPDWEKNSYWLFKSDTLASIMGFKDGIIKIPKSQEVGILFGSGMEAMLDATIGGKKAKDVFPGWAKAEADTLLPNLFSNAVTTPLELMANYSIFTGRNIIPDKFKNMPADKQVTDKTTGFAKAMADDINKIFGTKISPMEVDFAGKGVLGNIYKIPTTGSFGFERFEGKGTSSKALDAYYQRKEELTSKYNGINADSYETGHLKNAKAQKSVNLNKMDATDKYNYKRMQEADKLMQQVNDKVRKGKMSQEDGQKAKINIARAVKWK